LFVNILSPHNYETNEKIKEKSVGLVDAFNGFVQESHLLGKFFLYKLLISLLSAIFTANSFKVLKVEPFGFSPVP